MKKRVKKRALFLILFGVILLSVSIYFGYQKYLFSGTEIIDYVNNEIMGMLLGLVFGILFLIIGIIWMIRHRRNFDGLVALKRHGKKVHARFLRKEMTGYEVYGHLGTILFLQEDGGDTIFQTQPIFSEFSIKDIEEHVFDVYINDINRNDYYVDIEKHFGSTVRY